MGTKHFGFYKRGRFWWVRTDPITKAPRSTRCTDVEAAKAWRRERERCAADPTHAAQTTATLSEWGGRLLAMKRANRSEATARVCEQKLGHWVRILGAAAPLSTITPETVDDYVAQRRTEGVSDHTIVKELGELTQALKLAKRAGCFPGDLQALRPLDLHAGYKPRKRALSAEEVVRLLAHLEPYRAAGPAVMVALGLRLSEAFRLMPTDVDLGRGVVFVGGRKTEESEQTIPIVSMFAPLVQRALPYLPLSPWQNMLRDLARACRRAGIDTCTPNDLRRTHATLLKQRGASGDTARRLMRHTTERMVATVYDKPTPAQLSERVEREIALQKRDSGSAGKAKPGASLRTRTADLRFTKPSRASLFSAKPLRLAEFSDLDARGLTWPEVASVTQTLQRGRLAAVAHKFGLTRRPAR